MTIKTITITEEAYNKIKRIKEDGESFSQLFTRLAEEKTANIKRFFGILKTTDIDEERRKYKKIREDLSKDLTTRERGW